MKCQHCNSATQVIETRVSDGHIRRRRRCLACGARATSEERWYAAEIIAPKAQPKPAPVAKPAKQFVRAEKVKRSVETRRKIEDMSYFSEDNDYLSGIKGL